MNTPPENGRRPRQQETFRSDSFAPPRRRWPGLLVLGIALAGVGGAAVWSLRDHPVDTPVAASPLPAPVQDLRDAASAAARDGAVMAERGAVALGDAGITAAVKTALAADPALSALRIEVNTEDGVVRLEGPAPDMKARERAEVLAAAPEGVTRVDNRLIVTNN
jgi:hypothetical protein